MIVTHDNFEGILAHLSALRRLSVDTETTGLKPYRGDYPFSIIIGDGEDAFYFNFNEYAEFEPNDTRKLNQGHIEDLKPLFADPDTEWLMHNAKFDLAMLRNLGLEIGGGVRCTLVSARLLDSTLFPNQFSLAHLTGAKGDGAKKWLEQNKGYTEVVTPGKKARKKNYHFALVPWDIIVPYGERDAIITFDLADRQMKAAHEICAATPFGLPVIWDVWDNEQRLVRTVEAMERRGVLVDIDYCKRAAAACETTLRETAAEFENSTGEPYLESATTFQRVFADERDKWVFGKVTATGKQNPSFDSDVLSTFATPAAGLVLRHRKAKSDADYYNGFIAEADNDEVVHASFNQHGTTPGRFSSSNPNLQNLTKDEDAALDAEFVVRRAIIPRPGMIFHMLDYNQMEYRLMLEYAARGATDPEGVLALIDKVKLGLDVHEATALVAGISRSEAKTTNFATLYGAGITTLAGRLRVAHNRAREIRDSILRAAPEINTFVRRAATTAEKRGYVINWFGRRCSFPDTSLVYRAPNYIIQGGCADVVKISMNLVDEYLARFATKLVLTIHDELVLEGPPWEVSTVVPHVKSIMETVYHSKHLPLTCSVDHSHVSLADKIKGMANETALGRYFETYGRQIIQPSGSHAGDCQDLQ